jgi:hypothetical protein
VWHWVMYPRKPAGTHGHCGPRGKQFSSVRTPWTHVGPRGKQTWFCSHPWAHLHATVRNLHATTDAPLFNTRATRVAGNYNHGANLRPVLQGHPTQLVPNCVAWGHVPL